MALNGSRDFACVETGIETGDKAFCDRSTRRTTEFAQRLVPFASALRALACTRAEDRDAAGEGGSGNSTKASAPPGEPSRRTGTRPRHRLVITGVAFQRLGIDCLL
jgi:hypothetical protein